MRLDDCGDEATFSVEDTGPGISEEHRAHIFDRYWQAQETAQKGTGLGLFITKGIIEAHGGRIWLDGAASQGSTFRFTLPLTVRDSKPEAA